MRRARPLWRTLPWASTTRRRPRLTTGALCSRALHLHDSSLKSTLGVPIPLHEHAVSVGMPLWKHVVGYEEGDPAVHDKLALGYPRFVYHPFVKELVEVWKAKAVEQGLIGAHEIVGALPFPSRMAASRCRQLLLDAHSHEPGFPVAVHDVGSHDVHVVVFPASAAAHAKAYWQHSGEIVSSRKAQAVLRDLNHAAPAFLNQHFPDLSLPESHSSVTSDDVAGRYRVALCERIAALTQQSAEDVILTISGMAAIFKAFNMCKQALPGRRVVVFGFTYIDTLKICLRKEWSHGVVFLGKGDDADLQSLRELVKHEQIMGVFTEFPSNPLLQCPDLAALCDLGRQHSFPVIVDDTIANFHNVDPFAAGADATVTSLTKLFSGVGDVLAGSLVLNRGSKMYGRLVEALEGVREDCVLYDDDAAVVLRNGADFERRSAAINETTEKLTEWLRMQPGVKHLYYPKFTQRARYDEIKRPGGGYGGLFSVVLEPGLSPMAFYDNLAVWKGPSLGTNFTLACPYTLLAHYTELDFAAKYGIASDLVRVSVGLEPLEDLKVAFERALAAARAAPAQRYHRAAQVAG